MTIYSIIADNTYDQTCDSFVEAARVSEELREEGHRVKVVRHDSWDEAYALEDRMNH